MNYTQPVDGIFIYFKDPFPGMLSFSCWRVRFLEHGYDWKSNSGIFKTDVVILRKNVLGEGISKLKTVNRPENRQRTW